MVTGFKIVGQWWETEGNRQEAVLGVMELLHNLIEVVVIRIYTCVKSHCTGHFTLHIS